MPRVILKVGVGRALKVEARASPRNDRLSSSFHAVDDTQSNRETCDLALVRHRQLCRLSEEVELMIALAEQCLESIQHWIEQREKR